MATWKEMETAEPQSAARDGDAKVAGRAVLVGDVEGDATAGQGFRAEVDEVVLTRLTDAGDRLLIEIWRPGEPLRRVERE